MIQGDGIDHIVLERIVEATMDAGFSAQNVAFGMGGGLLQKVNRDTLSFACKLSYRLIESLEAPQGVEVPLMKDPKTDPNKRSQPGRLAVVEQNGALRGAPYITAYGASSTTPDRLELVYDCGPAGYEFENFHQQRERLRTTWAALEPRKSELGISSEMWHTMNRVSGNC